MDGNTPPRVTALPSVVALGTRRQLTDLITVTDPDEGAFVSQYQVRDNSAGLGSFLLGEEVLTANVWHTIPRQQINALRYRAAEFFGTETFSVRVQDSAGNFSNVATSTITTDNVSPELTVQNGRVAPFELIPISSLFSVFDGDGDTPTEIGFRDVRTNADGGRFVVRGEEVPQGQWNFYDYAELGDVLYRGADDGRDVEEIQILVKDAFSFGERATLEIATTAQPTLEGTGLSILVNQSRFAGLFIEFMDEDGDVPLVYNIIDRRINADGGFFTLNGVRQQSGQFFTVRASEFNQLRYVGGSTGPQSEDVSFHVFDSGGEWSELLTTTIRTVTPPVVTATDIELQRDHYINFATGGISPIQGAQAPGTPFLQFSDADGDTIEEFMFIDYALNPNGGHFVLDGARVPSGVHFRIPAADLPLLEYRAGLFGPQSEEISAFALSNGVWSEDERFIATSLPNQFRPELELFSANVRLGVSLQLEGLFTFSDGDGDIPVSFSIFDTGSDPTSGFFTDNGVVLPAREWITFDWSKRGDIRYNASDIASSEVIRMVIHDGRSTSTVASATITSVPAPELEAATNAISIDSIERVLVSSLVSQSDNGPGFTRYEIYDENTVSRSGRFELDGVDLQQGRTISLTAAEYDRLVFKGAESDLGRNLDPILVRGTNETINPSTQQPIFSDWERINVNTDPVGARSLISGLQWFDGNADFTEVTFSFIDGDNANLAGFFPPVPTYYTCAPDANPEQVCDQAGEAFALNQPQREAIREVLASYETYANVRFREVAATDDHGDSVITFGAADLVDGVAGIAFLPSGNVASGQGSVTGDVWFDTDLFHPNEEIDVSPGSLFRFVALHEVGHALGFKHPFALPNPLPIFSDFDYNTVMSNSHDNVHNPFEAYPEFPSTPSLYDAVALQQLYGVNQDQNIGNNHYGNGLSGSFPHFFSNTETHQSLLYDSGGIDTYNYTNHVADETIDLRQGTFSSINGVPQSLRTAYLSVIENARGGTGDDNIRGNEISNLLFGNDGNDVLRGGGDQDVLRGGAGNDDYIWQTGDSFDVIREEGNGGIDVLTILDPSGSIDSLQDDFTFRRFGNDLRMDLTFNQAEGQGTNLIVNYEDNASRVEILRIHDANGNQIGGDIDLQSIYNAATGVATRFRVTENQNDFGTHTAFAAVPV